MPSRLFTSESVTEGHPDKIADQISDTLLDAMLARRSDPYQDAGWRSPSRVARTGNLSWTGLDPDDMDAAVVLPGAETRTVDMPRAVAAEELKGQLAGFPPVEVELPWGKPGADSPRRKFPLVLTTRFGNAVAVHVETSRLRPAARGAL